MTKDIPYGEEVERIIERELEPQRILVNLYIEVYDKDGLMREILPQVDNSVDAANLVFNALVSNDVMVVNREEYPDMRVLPPNLRGECPDIMYIPRTRGTTVRVYVPDVIVGASRNRIIDWFQNGATIDGTPTGTRQFQSRVSRCTALLAYARYLQSGSSTLNLSLGTTLTYQVTIRPKVKIPTRVRETLRVPTHVATLRWGCSLNASKSRYMKTREIAVFYTPSTKETVDDKSKIEAILSALLDCVLDALGYMPISVLTNDTSLGYANPYSAERRSGKARFEISETSLNLPDGAWTYYEYDILDVSSTFESEGSFDNFMDLPHTRIQSGTINVEECLNSRSIKWR